MSREGFRVPTGSSGHFGERTERLELPEPLTAEIAPRLAMLAPGLNEQIGILDEKLGELSRKDERVKRLMTMPEIGPVTAVAYVATLDDAGRFRGAHQVEAYLGLVSREWSSSEVQRGSRRSRSRCWS